MKNSPFDDSENGTIIPKELRIVPPKDKPLNKEQQVFNRLTKSIEKLQNDILSDTEKYEHLLKIYTDKIPNLEKAIAENKVKLCKKISRSTQSIKFGKRELENIGFVIVDLCDQAFEVIEPDEETESMYNQWADVKYQEELEKQIHHEQSEPLNQEKSKKELKKELREKEEEAMKRKSVRHIYISLVKVLHPDIEIDPLEKLLKEELMKKVTVAYNDKDLPTLLKLEMEWVAAETNHLESMTKDRLKHYISTLKEQEKALENEKYTIGMHPRFQCVMSFARYPEAIAVNQIKSFITEHKKHKKALEAIIQIFSQPNPKKMILSFVNQSLEILERRNEMNGSF